MCASTVARAQAFVNTLTGEVLLLDPQEGRLRRMRRRLRHWERLLRLPSGKADFIGVTLTYRDGALVSPRDISCFLSAVRQRLGKDLLAYAWVAEIQRRGVLHYHVLFVVRKGVRIPKPDRWIWRKGSSSVRLVWRHVGYLTKYARKAEQKDLSAWRGFRMFAVVIRAWADLRRELRWSALPAWLVEAVRGMDLLPVLPRRRPGGGWEVWGRVLRSPWVWIRSIPDPDQGNP